MSKQIPNRSEVPLEQTWDLTAIYAEERDFEEALTAFNQELNTPVDCENITEDGRRLYSLLQKYEQQSVELNKLYTYASLHSAGDVTDNKWLSAASRAGDTYSRYSASWSFLKPSLAEVSEEQFTKLVQQCPELETYRFFWTLATHGRDHVLAKSEENLLAKLGVALDVGERVSGILSDSDLEFEDAIDSKGDRHVVNNATYMKLRESKDRKLRRSAYESYFGTYDHFKNTFAACLQKQIKQDNVLAELRGYDSARAYALHENYIPIGVYDRLVKDVNYNLPLLHRYTQLRKELTGVQDFHWFDNYVSVVDDVDFYVSFDEARQIICDALSPLGSEYAEILDRLFAERWTDYAVNQNKSSGAFSAGGYGTFPYLLISWQGTLDNLYTLAHEIGHSCHTYLSCKYQHPIYSHYNIFLAEIASTLNENLLTSYLLNTYEDEKLRKYVLDHYLSGFAATVFRQTQFAEFEQKIHESDQAGQALTAELLSDIYRETKQRYYGPALKSDDLLGSEWTYVSHFYYRFYVYQYATGFSIAAAFAERILTEGLKEVERYLGFLKSGLSDYPIEILAKAGIDVVSGTVVRDAMQTFANYLDLFEQECRK